MEGPIPVSVRAARIPVCIVADDRERVSPVLQLLAGRPDVRLDVRRLDVGDYEVEREWVFERKTVKDFTQSLIDGRLFRQAHRLAGSRCGRALILEGAEGERSGVSREAWQGALVSLGLAFQLPVLRTVDAAESVQLLVYAGRQAARQRDSVFVAKQRRPRSLERQRLQILAALPGVGAHRARRLLDHFGSVEATMLATEEVLARLHGIGPRTAQRIRRVVASGERTIRSSKGDG